MINCNTGDNGSFLENIEDDDVYSPKFKNNTQKRVNLFSTSNRSRFSNSSGDRVAKRQNRQYGELKKSSIV